MVLGETSQGSERHIWFVDLRLSNKNGRQDELEGPTCRYSWMVRYRHDGEQ